MKTLVTLAACAAILCVMAPTAFSADSGDQKFVTEASMGSMFEVEAGKIALTNAQNADVKQFGGQMVTDHSKAAADLAAIAAQKNFVVAKELDGKQQKTLEHLKSLKGSAFDNAYVKDMLEDHKEDHKNVSAATEKLQDPALKAFSKKLLETVDMHLKHVESLNLNNR